MGNNRHVEDHLLDLLETEMRVTLATSDDLMVASTLIDRLDHMLERLAGIRYEAADRFMRRLTKKERAV